MGRSHTPLHVESFGWIACLTSRVKILLDGFSTMPVACSDGMMEAASPVTNLKQLDVAVHWTLDFPVRSLKKKERCQSECLQHVSLVINSVMRKNCQKQNYLFTLVFLPSSWQEFQFVHWKFNFWNFGVVAWNLSKWSGTDSALNSLACKIFMW